MVKKNSNLSFLFVIIVLVGTVVFISYNEVDNSKYYGENTSGLVFFNSSFEESEFTDFYGLKVRMFKSREELFNFYNFFSGFDPYTRTYVLYINNTKRQKYIFDLDNLNLSVYHENGAVICNNTNLQNLPILFKTKDEKDYWTRRISDFESKVFVLSNELIEIVVYSNDTECDVLEKYDFDKYLILTHYSLDLSINKSMVLRRGFLTNTSVYRKHMK